MKIQTAKKKENPFMVAFFTLILLGFLSLILFNSCSDKGDIPHVDEDDKIVATFTSNIMPYVNTYATTTNLNSGEVVLYTGSSTTGKTYITSAGELIPKTSSDEIYLSSTPTLINAYYPKSELTLSGSDLIFTLSNTMANKDVNKDIVFATTTLTKGSTPYTLTFSHLYSLLEVEIVKGTTTDDISAYYPIYRGKNNTKFVKPYTNTYMLTGTETKFYFFDGTTPLSFGCIIPNDADAYITINNGTTDLPDKAYIKDLFTPPIEAGKKYKVTITVNQNELTIGSVTIENWTAGGNSTITIIT